MGVFDVIDLCSTQAHKVSIHSIPPAGRGMSEVEDREPHRDDAFWVAMLRTQHRFEKPHGAIWRLFHPGRNDRPSTERSRRC
jgi:hypothetical protein